jgi:hypothetical protein
MQPYLYYGFGFRAKNLPILERERLIDCSEDVFCWFNEDSAVSAEDDSGVYYIISEGPWDNNSKSRVNSCYPWAADLNEIIKFKENNIKNIDIKLQHFGLKQFKPKLEFLVSVTEI